MTAPDSPAAPPPDLGAPHVPTSHARPRATTQPLVGRAEADVVVVGAGIVGLVLAVELAEQGLDVLVLEAAAVGDGVTGRSTAKVTSLHQLVYADLVRRHGHEVAATYAAASQAAVSWLREAAGPVWQARPAATVARDDREAEQIGHEHAAALAAGLPVQLGPARDWPGSPTALRLEDQGQVDPVALLQRLRDRAVAAGARLHEGTPLTGLRERPGGAVVRTPTGSAAGRHVVLATGLPVVDRGGFFALVEPSTSYVVALAHDAGPPSGAGELLISAGSPTRSVRWAADAATGRQVLLVGGEGHRTGTGRPTAARYDRLEAWARQAYDGVGEVLARWSAEDFLPADRLPMAGPHLRLGGPVQVVTGLQKWGFALGTACATSLAARLVAGGTVPVDDFGRLVDTARLPDLQGVATVAQTNAEVAQHMATGWAAGLLRRAPDPASVAEGDGRVGRAGVPPLPRARCRVAGEAHDVAAVCTHLGGIVSWNDGDQTWDCPLHGSRFRADGTVRHGPAIRDLR